MRSGICTIFMIIAMIMLPAAADTLTIPGHTDSSQAQTMPERGVKMESVLAEFGEPMQRISAIGEPPISEWIYSGFRVYFEYEVVLHTIDMTTLIMPK